VAAELRASLALKDHKAPSATRACRVSQVKRVHRVQLARPVLLAPQVKQVHREPRANRESPDHPVLSELQDCLEIPDQLARSVIVDRSDTLVLPELPEHLD
jgi:hypothetical protein